MFETDIINSKIEAGEKLRKVWFRLNFIAGLFGSSNYYLGHASESFLRENT